MVRRIQTRHDRWDWQIGRTPLTPFFQPPKRTPVPCFVSGEDVSRVAFWFPLWLQSNKNRSTRSALNELGEVAVGMVNGCLTNGRSWRQVYL